MTDSEGETRGRGSAEFVESSVLEAIVPASSDIDIEKEVQAWTGTIEDENSSILPSIPQRSLLLLGTFVRVALVGK